MTYKWAAGLVIYVLYGVASAKVYRWTDEQGGTHFGQQLPGGYSDIRIHAEDKTTELPVIAPAQAPSKSLSHLNCEQAIANASYSLGVINKTAKNNFIRGIINKQNLAESTARTEIFINKLSIEQCEDSVGIDRTFYACVENYKNHILYCVERFEGS